MPAEDALKILKSLAEGIDPESGELIARTSVVQRPDVIRALYEATGALRREVWRDKRRRQLPENAGKAWAPDEDARLLTYFGRGTSLEVMADLHKRTAGAIRERLVRLGRLQPVN